MELERRPVILSRQKRLKFFYNPEKAIISLKNDRETSYKVYIAVQNELVAAYNVLRDREFARLNPLAGMTYTEAQKRYNDPRTSADDKAKLKPKLDEVKVMIHKSFLKLNQVKPTKTTSMSKFKKKKGGDLPAISTASLLICFHAIVFLHGSYSNA